MKYSDIQAFLSVVEHESISKAAENLYVSQPTLSRQIRAMEKELGVPLFIRTKGVKRIELTQRGRSFLPLAEKWVELWKQTHAYIDQPVQTSLRISAIHSIGEYIVAQACAQFADRHPEVQMDIQTWVAMDVCHMIERGLVEAAFILKTQFSKTVKARPIFEEKMVLVCGNELSVPQTVSVKELSVENEVFSNWNTGMRQWQSYWFGPYQEPRIRTNNLAAVQTMMEIQSFWTIVPASIAWALQQKGLRICKIKEQLPVRIGYLALRHDTQPSDELQLFLQEMREVVLMHGSRWLYEDNSR